MSVVALNSGVCSQPHLREVSIQPAVTIKIEFLNFNCVTGADDSAENAIETISSAAGSRHIISLSPGSKSNLG